MPFFPLELDSELVVLPVYVACIVGLRTRRGTARSCRGLPVACYESCQSPECNRYRGPEVGIEPIRSAPPRACRRPGRFIMLISLRQGSRAPRALSGSPLIVFPLVHVPFYSRPATRPVPAARRRPVLDARETGESEEGDPVRRDISREIGLVS